jgi:hypothetical protein
VPTGPGRLPARSRIANGDIEVASQARELLGRRMVLAGDALGIEVPAVQDRDARPDVAHSCGEVDGFIRGLGNPAAAGHDQSPPVHERDLLLQVLEPRRHQQRAEARTE